MIAYMTSSPALSGKARDYGRNYRRLALVELEPGWDPTRRPAMISERARGVARIVEDYTVHVGSTPRSEGYRLDEALRARADVEFG